MLINAATQITLLSCSGSVTTGSSEHRQGLLLQPKHIELMGHVIFARTIVLVGGIQTEVCNLAAVQACKSLDLMSKSGILVTSLHELSPHLMKLLMMLPLSLLMKAANMLSLLQQINMFREQLFLLIFRDIIKFERPFKMMDSVFN